MARSTYTDEQISRYFEHISLPHSLRSIRKPGGRTQDALPFLRCLQVHQMGKVPFENLNLHYNIHHDVSLDPAHLYDKIVVHNRGGHCMENNAFFATVLRSLGYKMYSAGARVCFGPGHFNGWSHMVNIVTIDGQRYMVDVGFGSMTATQALPLIDGQVHVNMTPRSVRLQHATLPQHEDSSQKLWRFQFRNTDDSLWTDGYAFTELEFFPEDFAVMNLDIVANRKSWFTQKVVCLKMLLQGDDTDAYAEGVLVLFERDIKWRRKGKVEHQETFQNEEQRVAALKKHFQIELNSDERKAIMGLCSEIKGNMSM